MGTRGSSHEAVCAALLNEDERDQEGGCVVDVNLNAADGVGESYTGSVRPLLTE